MQVSRLPTKAYHFPENKFEWMSEWSCDIFLEKASTARITAKDSGTGTRKISEGAKISGNPGYRSFTSQIPDEIPKPNLNFKFWMSEHL
jgi:hypothetical protein